MVRLKEFSCIAFFFLYSPSFPCISIFSSFFAVDQTDITNYVAGTPSVSFDIPANCPKITSFGMEHKIVQSSVETISMMFNKH
jgi:hypothetical protein